MKKTVLLWMWVALLAAPFTTVQAQEKKECPKKKCEMIHKRVNRCEMLANKFQLQGEAKDKFVKLYNEYRNDLKEAVKSQCPKLKDMKKPEGRKKRHELTDAEATQRMQDKFKCEETKLNIMTAKLKVHKKYHDKFAKILTPKQVLMVVKPQGFDNPKPMMRKGGNKCCKMQKGPKCCMQHKKGCAPRKFHAPKCEKPKCK